MSPKTGRITITSGQSESSVLELVSETLVGIYMPAAWDAADLAFLAGSDGQSFSEIHEFGSALTAQAAAGQYIPLDFAKFVGAAYIKVRSESGGSVVNQTAERILTPVFRTLE